MFFVGSQVCATTGTFTPVHAYMHTLHTHTDAHTLKMRKSSRNNTATHQMLNAWLQYGMFLKWNIISHRKEINTNNPKTQMILEWMIKWKKASKCHILHNLCEVKCKALMKNWQQSFSGHVCVHLYVCAYVNMCVPVYVCTYVCICMCAYTHIYLYMHICVYA